MNIATKQTTGNARERILDAAEKVLARHGYQSANVDEIISLSKTSKGGFYFHFPSKEKMVMGLVTQLTEKLALKVEQSLQKEARPLNRIAAAIDVLLHTFSSKRRLAQVLLINVVGQGKAMDKKFLPVRDRFAKLIQMELDRAIDAGVIAPQDTKLASHMWLGSIHEVILQWLMADRPPPITDTVPALRALLLRSVGVDLTLLQEGDGEA